MQWLGSSTLSFLSVIGIVALSGVVVNASLVLVDYVNRRAGRGRSAAEAVGRPAWIASGRSC